MTLLQVTTSGFYETGTAIGHGAAYFFLFLFTAMFLYATIKYVKR